MGVAADMYIYNDQFWLCFYQGPLIMIKIVGTVLSTTEPALGLKCAWLLAFLDGFFENCNAWNLFYHFDKHWVLSFYHFTCSVNHVLFPITRPDSCHTMSLLIHSVSTPITTAYKICVHMFTNNAIISDCLLYQQSCIINSRITSICYFKLILNFFFLINFISGF